MRVTNRLIAENFIFTVQQQRRRMTDLQADLATSKRLRRPSDDPAGFGRVVRFKQQVERNEQFLENVRLTSERLDEALAVLDSAVDLLSRAKELATQGASETLDADARAAMSEEIQQIFDELLNVANARHNGKYLFAGTQTVGEAPFKLEDETVTYNGDEADIRVRIGEEVTVVSNRPGNQIFQPAGGVDVFGTLLALKRALDENDTDTIVASIDQLDSGIKQVLATSSAFGALQERLTLTEEFLERRNVRLADFISVIEDTDVVEATVELQVAQTAQQFAMRSFADLIQTSLLNFIS